MSLSTSKRNFLFARISARNPVRPPWALKESEFIDLCTRCDECEKQCPVNVIRIGDGGYPEIDFSNSGCDFCQVCVDVCKSGALSHQQPQAFNLVASIDDSCFSERGVICRSCAEVCDKGAISFKQVVGGISHLIMNTKSCNGCGECVSICPATAIKIEHRSDTEKAG
ncbi:MAG: ferredoxin-type protein NapF [Gammaproteobacteria bacterium]|nr:ferredoxin-type protein NapF [Gammaproteobacteria bacterium]